MEYIKDRAQLEQHFDQILNKNYKNIKTKRKYTQNGVQWQ